MTEYISCKERNLTKNVLVTYCWSQHTFSAVQYCKLMPLSVALPGVRWRNWTGQNQGCQPSSSPAHRTELFPLPWTEPSVAAVGRLLTVRPDTAVEQIWIVLSSQTYQNCTVSETREEHTEVKKLKMSLVSTNFSSATPWRVRYFNKLLQVLELGWKHCLCP